MKKLFLLFIFFFILSNQVFAGIALVSSAQKVSSNSTNVVTTGIDTTGATLLVVSASSLDAPTITDSKGNTWTKLTTYKNATSGAWQTIAYVINPTVGTSHTFTNTASFPGISVVAFSGATTSSPFDQQNGASCDNTTTCASGSITPGENNEVIVAGIGGCTGSGGDNSCTADSGMTNVGYLQTVGGSGYGTGIAYKVQATAASINVSWTGPAASYFAQGVASFKATAAAVVSTLSLNNGRFNNLFKN